MGLCCHNKEMFLNRLALVFVVLCIDLVLSGPRPDPVLSFAQPIAGSIYEIGSTVPVQVISDSEEVTGTVSQNCNGIIETQNVVTGTVYDFILPGKYSGLCIYSALFDEIVPAPVSINVLNSPFAGGLGPITTDQIETFAKSASFQQQVI